VLFCLFNQYSNTGGDHMKHITLCTIVLTSIFVIGRPVTQETQTHEKYETEKTEKTEESVFAKASPDKQEKTEEQEEKEAKIEELLLLIEQLRKEADKIYYLM